LEALWPLAETWRSRRHTQKCTLPFVSQFQLQEAGNRGRGASGSKGSPRWDLQFHRGQRKKSKSWNYNSRIGRCDRRDTLHTAIIGALIPDGGARTISCCSWLQAPTRTPGQPSARPCCHFSFYAIPAEERRTANLTRHSKATASSGHRIG